MKRPETRRARLAAGLGGVLAAGVLAGGLWAVQERDRLDLDDDAPWRTSTDPVAIGGLAWATGSTVHLGDGTALDVGSGVAEFVVAGGGVFFVPEIEQEVSWPPPPPDPYAEPERGPEILFAAPGREPAGTGLPSGHDGIAVSPDGTTLAMLDADYDSGRAVMRFFDLTTGEALTSDDGMENDDEDPVHHLLESEVAILASDEHGVHARGTEGDFVYDWETGEGVPAEEAEEIPVRRTGRPDSPDGRWRIDSSDAGEDRVVHRDGEEVALAVGEPRWEVSWWADHETVVGSVIEGPGTTTKSVPGDESTLMTCVVPAGECTTYPESAGRRIVLPIGLTDYYGVHLGGVDE